MRWPTVQIAEVAAVFNGKTPSKTEQRESGHPVLKIRDVSATGRFRGPFESFVDPQLAQRQPSKLLQRGDSLVLNAAHNVSHVASKTYFAEPIAEGALITGEWLVIRTNADRLEPKFANHWLNSTKTRLQLREIVNGIHLYPKDVARLTLALPPLQEQRRIAEILDCADMLRAKRRDTLALLDDLMGAIFIEMFGDPYATSGWEQRTLASVAAAVNDCPHSTPIWSAVGVTCLRTSNLTVGGWDWTDHRFVSEETYVERSRRGELLPGDIVLSREGTVGVAAIVPEGLKVCMGQRLVQVRPDRHIMRSEFLLRFLLNVLKPERIGAVMVGSTARHLNVKELKLLRVPVPPLSLQEQYAERVSAVSRAAERATLHAANLEDTTSSLQQRAFAGLL